MGEVDGTVTLDGQPLKGVLVNFYPEEGGRASTGFTDDSGKFELHFTNDAKGGIVGWHKITVNTADDGDGGGDGFTKAFPRSYQDKEQTDLRQEIKKGSNDVVLALVSK